ncbi:MAG: molybdopterin-dependent oxidoreductase [Bacteriovoracaceae bacterium]|jgi:thiosulfate reductase / polysulfide reductase chain A|nr:molybdopterin-dependent oxidoreductase [Bacteriovoracaceae bacterium]
MKRVGARGAGKWKRITWDQALDEVGGWMAELKKKGKEEELAFHYGRMKGSSSKIIKSYFLPAFGTKTIMGHTSICEGSKWVGQEMVWGKHYDSWDVENTKLIINFGSNVMAAHTNHIPVVSRLSKSLSEGVKMYTFDVRLSETAAKSTEWIPVKPGTDSAVMLAMIYHIVNSKLTPKRGQKFIAKYTNTTLKELTEHVTKNGYTPDWAQKISGVPSKKIIELATLYAKTWPANIMTYRGVASHHNGTMGERISLTLQALCGNIDVKGGTCRAVSAKWKNTFKKPKASKKLKITNGEGYLYPTHGACQNVLEMIRDGKKGRPSIYMWYCYTPVFANGDMKESQKILADESIIPHTVCINTSYDESAVFADILLPDATYLERWDWEDMVSPDQIAEYYIRQPIVSPMGEARDFKDVVYDLAKVVDKKANLKGSNAIASWLPFKTAKEFVKDACENTKGVKEAGGFEYMVKHGVWHDRKAKPKYLSHEKILSKKMKSNWGKLDTGLVYDKSKSKDGKWDAKQGKNYVGQMIDGVIYHGFPPDKGSLKTGRSSGLFTISHEGLAKKSGGKYPKLPAWMPIPGHDEVKIGGNKFILTTFKVAAQIHSRSQNCKYLSEISHSEPAWIHPQTAKSIGVLDGEVVEVASDLGKISTKVKLTHRVHPQVIALAHHFGHWEYGRYASGKKATTGESSNKEFEKTDKDSNLMWWSDFGVRPNWIISNKGDPIGGGMATMDTVVTVKKTT